MKFALLALLLALPAQARRHPRKPAGPPPRAEDDPRKKGDSPAFAKASVKIAAPADLARIEFDLPIQVELQVENYAIGALQPGGAGSAGDGRSPQGAASNGGAGSAGDGRSSQGAASNGPVPHAHLIVDNEPAAEIDDLSRPVTLKLDAGPHLLRAVLCRPWHEVVKAPHAFAMARFWVGPPLPGKAGKAAEYVAWPDPKKPILTYVLPLGASPAQAMLEGAAEPQPAPPGRPVLDFYLANGKLARRGDKVRVVLDRRELPLITDWKPLRLRRARGGTHKVTIDLLNRRGLKVKNAVNRTDRVFSSR